MTAIQTPQSPPLETTAFDELGGSFRGELLLPTSPGYDTAHRIWNGAIDRHPACIARCTGVADVVAAVGVGREPKTRSLDIFGRCDKRMGHTKFVAFRGRRSDEYIAAREITSGSYNGEVNRISPIFL